MNVLHQRFFERGGIATRTNQGRDAVEAEPASRPPSALTRDQFKLLAHRAHENRLQDAHFTDRVGQSRE